LIKRWANHYDDPEYLVKRSNVLELTDKQRKELFWHIRIIADCLRKVFETSDDYERDWFLYMARYNNAAGIRCTHLR
jgi:DNA-binding MarR family transcriptional regulator